MVDLRTFRTAGGEDFTRINPKKYVPALILDDGTMIVVEGGIRFLNAEIPITVTRVLQTVAGRMIFAQPRGEAG